MELIYKNQALIFDCRDDDFHGGNIVGSFNTPDAFFEEKFLDLAVAKTQMRGKEFPSSFELYKIIADFSRDI